MSYKVWESINTIDEFFVDDPNNTGKDASGGYLSMYCPGNNCSSDEQKIIAGFIMLLNMLDDENIDGEKLVEYAILWLSYKLNQKKQNETTILNDFYTDNIETNSCYDEHITSDTSKNINKGVIEKKMKSMNMDIKDISNFYDPFKSLFNMYSELGPEKNTQCKTCLENAGELFEKYEKLKNSFEITKGYLYSQLWSSLSIDYHIFESKYNAECNNVSPLVACPRSSVTKNTLITIAIIFVAASILLGVSYKYSLFGFRKRSQKQHLREMLKK
ncbi:PIR protein [Plasmodium yoelii]|uniref:PIR protein n=2 Tax=Plasmodium yoelii TaxID=5861 RepID=A0AAE9WS09_PLAYO|nr:PIR protein [Plasmodium yoelii]XP_034493613.1 PIR protein [Plasmodium yoelii]WBY58957.1 PIR protein [Plasmodium yoelii yoelii]WBY59643.1 PIR protein [Plasmodium yoelii yoelii]CDS44263.1 YIR protein [Plasmodium yoelii]VTZ79789.1 PIR protein [Plasmodium yoelii]VTZ80383.1 PIR protein [Plasmodium yoelii]|eukprot:XP_022813447.1 PIR protein [Plasmodium yoelii]